jgi:hypothetical protein
MIGCQTPPTRSRPLPIIILEYPDHSTTRYLANDYGFLIQWPSASEAPDIYLYDKPAHRIHHYSELESFLAELERIPDGSPVDRIRGCFITTFGMPPADGRRLTETLRRKRLRLTDEEDGNFGVCSCETTNVRLLTDAP